METVISELSKNSKDAFHVVRLNGFIHTDDKLALKEIWRQLGKEMQVDDELVNKVGFLVMPRYDSCILTSADTQLRGYATIPSSPPIPSIRD